MTREPLLQLYGEAHPDAVRKRMTSGCVSVLVGSTWGQFAASGPGFTKDDVARMAGAMVTYILAQLHELSDLSVELSGRCYLIGSIFDPYEFARQFSEDLLCESAHIRPDGSPTVSGPGLRDRATAAVLFRYKYCFLAEEFFPAWGIVQWARIAQADRQLCETGEAILQLLDALESVTGSELLDAMVLRAALGQGNSEGCGDVGTGIFPP